MNDGVWRGLKCSACGGSGWCMMGRGASEAWPLAFGFGYHLSRSCFRKRVRWEFFRLGSLYKSRNDDPGSTRHAET